MKQASSLSPSFIPPSPLTHPHRRGHEILKWSLPDKFEHVLLVRPSPVQAALYDHNMHNLQQGGTSTTAGPLKAFAVCTKVRGELEWNEDCLVSRSWFRRSGTIPTYTTMRLRRFRSPRKTQQLVASRPAFSPSLSHSLSHPSLVQIPSLTLPQSLPHSFLTPSLSLSLSLSLPHFLPHFPSLSLPHSPSITPSLTPSAPPSLSPSLTLSLTHSLSLSHSLPLPPSHTPSSTCRLHGKMILDCRRVYCQRPRLIRLNG